MGSVSDESCRKNQNTHFMCKTSFFRKSYRLWGNVEKCYSQKRHRWQYDMEHALCMPDNEGNNTDINSESQKRHRWQYNMEHALRMTDNEGNNTDINSEHLIIIAFPRQNLLHERASVVLYVYCLSCCSLLRPHTHKVAHHCLLRQCRPVGMNWCYKRNCYVCHEGIWP